MPTATATLLKLHKPAMSLKQFMLRSEVIKLYRGFMRLGRLMDTPSLPSTTSSSGDCNNNSSTVGKLHPLQLEWIDWVRSEFRLREQATDEEVIRMNLAYGKRQLQEMERTISLAANRNLDTSSHSSKKSSSSCGQSKEKNS